MMLGTCCRCPSCGRFLGHVPGHVLYVGPVRRAPCEPDGDAYKECPDHGWHHFKAIDRATVDAMTAALAPLMDDPEDLLRRALAERLEGMVPSPAETHEHQEAA